MLNNNFPMYFSLTKHSTKIQTSFSTTSMHLRTYLKNYLANSIWSSSTHPLLQEKFGRNTQLRPRCCLSLKEVQYWEALLMKMNPSCRNCWIASAGHSGPLFLTLSTSTVYMLTMIAKVSITRTLRLTWNESNERTRNFQKANFQTNFTDSKDK